MEALRRRAGHLSATGRSLGASKPMSVHRFEKVTGHWVAGRAAEDGVDPAFWTQGRCAHSIHFVDPLHNGVRRKHLQAIKTSTGVTLAHLGSMTSRMLMCCHNRILRIVHDRVRVKER